MKGTKIKNILLAIIASVISLFLAEVIVRYVHSFEGHAKNLNGYIFSWFGTRYLEDHKESETFRIVTIGDSFTYGMGVKFEETYPFFMERFLKSSLNNQKIEVVNLGALGRNAVDINLLVHRNLLKFKPDLVVYLITSNDREFARWQHHPYLYCKNFWPPSVYKLLYVIMRNSRIFYLIYDRFFRYDYQQISQRESIAKGDKYFECSKQAINETISFFKKYGIKYAVAYHHDLSLGYKKLYCESSKIKSNIINIFKEQYTGDYLYVTDFLNVCHKPTEQYFLDDYYHFSAKGNEILAQRIGQYIIDKRYIKNKE